MINEDHPKGSPPPWPEPWAAQASAEAAAIRCEKELAASTGPDDPRRRAAFTAVESMLAEAEWAIQRPKRSQRGDGTGVQTRYQGRRSWSDRWRGTSIEWAHYYLHAAKVSLVDVLSPAELEARIPSAVARLATCLAATDTRRLHLDRLSIETNLDRKRAGLKQALEIGYNASDALHGRVRSFRNILIVAGVIITCFMGAFVTVVAFHPNSVPMCFEPTITSAATAASGVGTTRQVCPGGEEQISANGVRVPRGPQSQDILIVAGLGLLGGALAAALAIRKVRGTSTPYDIPLALAVLKAPTGALTAVIGMLLLSGGFIPGLSELDSQRQILAYALLFGYAQQIGTQFIDKRAESILSDVPSKDDSGKQPTPPAQPIPSPSPAPAMTTNPTTTNPTTISPTPEPVEGFRVPAMLRPYRRPAKRS